MYKFFLLASTRFKILFIIIILLCPLIIAFYFIYTNFIETSSQDKPFLISYNYRKPLSNEQDLINSLFYSDHPFNDNNGNLVFIKCNANKKTSPSLNEFNCSILTKDYFNHNVAILTIIFKNTTEYFGKCIYPSSPINTELDDDKYKCDFSEWENNKEQWFQDVVLNSASAFLKKLYESLKFGPELRLIKLIEINRGNSTIPIIQKESTYGEYIKQNIRVYISSANNQEQIDKDYYEAIANQKGKTGVFSRNKNSLMQSIINYYGMHITTFNKYSGRNTRFNITRDISSNPQHGFFKLSLSLIDKSFGLEKKKKDDFHELLVLANKDIVTKEERDRAIQIFQDAVNPIINNERKLRALTSILPNSINKRYFQNCSPQKTYTYKSLNGIIKIISNKNEVFKKIKSWFNLKEVLRELYVILTSKTAMQDLNICPDLKNDEYNYLNYYLSFMLFGFNPYVSITSASSLSNLIFYKIWDWNNLQLSNKKNKGILLTRNVDKEKIDNSFAFTKFSEVEKVTYFTYDKNTYYKLFYVTLYNLRIHQDKTNFIYSIFLNVKSKGVTILPFNWNNIAYKGKFLQVTQNDFINLKLYIGGYIASFNLVKGEETALARKESTSFIFNDKPPINLYNIGETQIYLDKLPTYEGDSIK